MRREIPTGLEYDEFGQGYLPGTGTLIVCVCGEIRENGDWSDHYCPVDEPIDDPTVEGERDGD